MSDNEPLTKTKITLQRLENTIALVDADINGDKPLDYRNLLSEMKTRLSNEQMSELLLSIHDELEGLDKLFNALDTPGLQIISGMFSFLSSVLQLIGLGRKRRALTTGEKIIVGLCLATIILTAASFALGLGFAGLGLVTLGFVLTGFLIGRAVISLIKLWKTIREKEVEFADRKQTSVHSKEAVDQLIAEINDSHSKKSEAENLRKLRLAVDKYVVDGYAVHRLRAALEHPRNILSNRISSVSGGLVLVGGVVLLFNPLAGGIIIALAGLIATVTLVAGLIHRRHELKALSLKDAIAVPEDLCTKDSTAIEIEMLELNSLPTSQKPTAEMSDKLDDRSISDAISPSKSLVDDSTNDDGENINNYKKR